MTDQKRPELDTVIFDVGNVLVRFAPRERLTETYDAATADALCAAMFDTPHWKELDRGVLPLEQILHAVQQENPAVAHLIEDVVYRQYPTWLSPIEESAAYLPRLKAAGYRLYVLSNFGETFFAQLRPVVGFFEAFDGIVLSGAEKLLKPDPVLYHVLLERYAIDPSRAVFFDDLPENVQAARDVGLQAQVFTDATQLEALLNPTLPGYGEGR